MWAGSQWDSVHKDVYKYVNCGIHKHADLEDMRIGIWNKEGIDPYGNWVRLKVMEPFLFMQPYAFSNCSLWAKAAELLPKESFISDGRVEPRTKNIIVLVDTVAYYLPRMLQFIEVLSQNCQQTRSLLVQNKRTAGDLLKCVLLDDATKCIAQNELYKLFKKYVPLNVYNEKMLIAAFCITFVTWHQTEDWHHKSTELGTKLTTEQKDQKDLGNEEYDKGEFFQAVATYTKIIKSTPDNAIVFGNRAQAFIKLEKYNEAEIDGRRVVILDPYNCKGYLRIVKAKEGLKDFHGGHELAIFGFNMCCASGKGYNELFDTSVILRDQCVLKGPCRDEQKFQHRVNSSKHKNEKSVSKTENLPELVSSSDESSDKEESSCSLPSEESVLPKLQEDKKQPTPPKMFEYNLLELLQQLKNFQQQGSEMLLAGKCPEAVAKYLQALEIIPKLAEQNFDIDVEDKVCLKYALGVAYQGGSSQHLLNSLEVFQEILNNYGELKFTLAHSAIGDTYRKLFRFDQALEHLTVAQESVEKGTVYRTYNWPGTKNVIEASIPEKHKEKMTNLIQLCQYPPNPDAVCRSDLCLLPSKNIYLGDPEFKGHYRLSCESGCRLEYHSQCWKRVKESLDRNKKSVVGQICLTPDCGSLVTQLEKFDNKGTLLTKSGNVDEDKKETKKRTKAEKKKEARKNQKQKERTQQLSVCESEEPIINDTPETLVQETSSVVKNTEPNKIPAPPSYAVNDEPVYVIRKGDPVQTNGMQTEKTASATSANGKKKKQKAKKPVTISVQEFCGELLDAEATPYNQYLKRVQELQRAKAIAEQDYEDDDELVNWPPLLSSFTLNPDSPFFIPEHLRDNPEALEQVLRQYSTPTPKPVALPAPTPIDQNEEIKKNIYEYMENLFRANGPCALDSEMLTEELNCFPGPAQALITDYGGLASFLKQNDRFILDGNVVYLAPEESSEDIPEKTDPDKVINDVMLVNTDMSAIQKGSEKDVPVSVVEETTRQLDTTELVSHIDSFSSHSSQCDMKIRRSDSWESDKSNSANVDKLTASSGQALRSIQKLTKSFSTDLQVALFKLQVSITALTTVEQQQVLCSVINSVKSGLCNDFWENVNPCLESVEVTVKGKRNDDKELTRKELERVNQANKNLEERLSSALDTISKLQNMQSLNKKQYQEDVEELKSRNQKLQSELNAVQTRVESEKLHLQQERTKTREEAITLRKEKEEEVATARKLLTQVTEENDKLKLKLDRQKDDYKRLKTIVTSLVENCEEATKQAQNAKEDLVKLKESEGIKLLDQELEYVIKTKAQILGTKKKEEAKPTLSPSVFQVLVDRPLQDCEAYHKTLKDLKNSFITLVNEHMEAIQKGMDPPKSSLDIPTLPTKPESLSTIGTAALAAMSSTTSFPMSYLNKPVLQIPTLPQAPSGQVVNQSSSISTPNVYQNSMFRSATPQPLMGLIPTPEMSLIPTIASGYPGPPITGMLPQARPLVPTQQPIMHIPQSTYSHLPLGYSFVTSGTQQALPLDNSVNSVPRSSLSSNQMLPANTNSVPDSKIYTATNDVPSQDKKSGTTNLLASTMNLHTPVVNVNMSSLVPGSTTSVPDVRRGAVSVPPGMAPLTNSMPPQSGWTPQVISTTATVNGVQHSIASTQSMATAAGVKPKLDSQQVYLTKTPVTLAATTVSAASKSHFDKLIRKLQENNPMMTSAELHNYVQEFRSLRQGSLSGMTFDTIIEGVSALIQKMTKQESQKARVITPALERGGGREQVLRRPYSGLEAVEKNTLNLKGSSKDPWGASSSASQNWAGSDDNTCSICLETMIQSSAIHETDCKHRFHYKCIQEWLKRNSKCPNCNSHTLLPTDFPPLGS